MSKTQTKEKTLSHGHTPHGHILGLLSFATNKVHLQKLRRLDKLHLGLIL